MATTYNIVEKRYNGTDYDTLYPATKGENLVSPVPVELGGTGGTTGAAGMKNLLDALSTVTPTGTDLLPLKDVSGNIAGKATIDSILSLVSGGAKIQTGSYVGTGTYGQANPCSLTFDFRPTLLMIFQGYIGAAYNNTGSVSSISTILSNLDYGIGYIETSTSAFSGTNVFGIYGGSYSKYDDDTNTFSWYTTQGGVTTAYHLQFNARNTTYHYLAIG